MFVDRVAAPQFVPALAHTCIESCVLSLRTATDGATVYYSLNESAPSNRSTAYSKQVSVTSTGVVAAIAYKSGLLPSAVVFSGLQTIRASPPVFTPPERLGCGGHLAPSCNVSLSTSVCGAVVYYRVFDQADQAAASCNVSQSYQVYLGDTPVTLLKTQSMSAYVAKAPDMEDSFEIFWPAPERLTEQSAESLSRVLSKVCATTSSLTPWAGSALSIATAGTPTMFFIVARDSENKLVTETFDGVLPWRITLFRSFSLAHKCSQFCALTLFLALFSTLFHFHFVSRSYLLYL